jgi:hypothetical protein
MNNKILNMFYKSEENKIQNTINLRNGRVNILGTPIDNTTTPLFEQSDIGNHTFRQESLGNGFDNTRLQTVFLGFNNIETMQKLIRYHVYRISEGRHTIKRQDDTQLQTVMKSVYLMYGKNLDTDIKTQVKELNSYVLDYCVPNILSNIEQYIIYKSQVSAMPVPLELPQYTSASGTRTQPDFIF